MHEAFRLWLQLHVQSQSDNPGEPSVLEAQEVVLLCVTALFPNLPKTDLSMTERAYSSGWYWPTLPLSKAC